MKVRPTSLAAACFDKSCAPPPTGTGGSRPGGRTVAVQSVVRGKVADKIREEGFKIIREPVVARHFGDGVYFAPAGDAGSESMYQAMKNDPQTIYATLKLDNPLTIRGDTEPELATSLVNQLGGFETVHGKMVERYNERVEVFKEVGRETLVPVVSTNTDAVDRWVREVEDVNTTFLHFWDFTVESVQRFSDEVYERGRYKAFDEEERGLVRYGVSGLKDHVRQSPYTMIPKLANLARDVGHDALIVETNSLHGWIGGNQIVVFDESKIKIDPIRSSGSHIWFDDDIDFMFFG